MPEIMLMTMASALLTKSQADDPGGALRSCRESRCHADERALCSDGVVVLCG
jgi:hypothetical protein